MSLKFVTKKLEGQSLEEELNGATAKEVEDSGTESDDETEPEAGEGDSDNVDSGISLNLRSASKLGGKSRQLPPLTKEAAAAAPTVDPLMDDQDNHSSEEELEDIIGNSATNKVYVTEPAAPSLKAAGGGAGRTSAVEKRKWSEVDHSSSSSTGGTRTGSGSSGDDEVSGYMEGSYTPVQFCTSPPLNVYKPRRSQSPPPKLFHLASNGWDKAPANQTCFREGQRPSGAFRPKGAGAVPTRGSNLEEEGEEEERTPNKRHRITPRPHNIQRPCLDFEKMQQIKTKVVTSWRQGAELSLFCW